MVKYKNTLLRRGFGVVFFLLVGFFVEAQSLCMHGTATEWHTSPGPGISGTTEAKTIIANIVRVLGLKQNFKVQAANIPNAAAVVYKGERYILYNPSFIKNLISRTGNEWAAISVLAHEIGHHLNGHTLDGIGSRPDKELEADEFSGFVLAKMGAPLSAAQAAMRLLPASRHSLTHPAQDQRLAAIARGWGSAGNTASNKDIASAGAMKDRPAENQMPSVPSRINKSVVQTVLAPQYIWKSIHFSADNSASYYITVRANVVRVQNNKLTIIGKLAKVNSSKYPYCIQLANDQILLINQNGRIITDKGFEVGVLNS